MNPLPFFQFVELVSAELCLELVESISREQAQNLLKDIAAKTGVKWIETLDTFVMLGTFKQVKESRAFLQQGIHQSNGVMVVDKVMGEAMPSQRREESGSQLDCEAEKDWEGNHDSFILEAAIEAIRPEEKIKETRSDHTPSFSSDIPEIQSFEIEPKIVKAFFKSQKNKLDDVEAKYKVKIPRKPEGTKISLKPGEGCSADEYEEACICLINLYLKMYQQVKMERFWLKSEKFFVRSRKAISDAERKFPISIEMSRDRKHWDMYGEASHIEEALKFLKQEGVEIKRETEMVVDIPEIHSFEIDPKIVKAFFKSHKHRLDDIEAKHKVEIPRKPEGTKMSLKPGEGCSADEYETAGICFINLYQKMYQLVKMERFSLKSEKFVVRPRKAISEAERKFPIWIELSKDRKHWEMYGEASHIKHALKFLKQEGVELKRETEMAVDEDGRRNKTKDYEENMDVDSPEYHRDAISPGNQLLTHFG